MLNASIWHIKQDGTGNFTTIQAGIDYCTNGDTLLVYPGTYYENLVIIEKYMTIGSLYLTTGDESYISQTIIDGFQNGCVIRIENILEYYQIQIIGFVVQHGIGYTTNINNPFNKKGGGFYIDNADIEINKCIIKDNKSLSGGGIYLYESVNLSLVGSTIKYNRALNKGGGIYMAGCVNISYDEEVLNNIYLNFGGVASDIFVSYLSPFQEIIVDTFTVADPAEGFYFIYPTSGGAGFPQPGLFSVEIQNAKIEQVNHDLYVSPVGDNNNSGSSASDPLQSIAYALANIRSDSLMHKNIYFENGIYSASFNSEYFPLHLKSYINLEGESQDNTILDAEFYGGHITAYDPQKSCNIKNLTLINASNKDNIFIGQNENFDINNVQIVNHIDDFVYLGGAAIKIHFSDVSIENTIINNNFFGGGLYLYTTKNKPTINLKNCIVTDNSSISSCIQIRIDRAIPLSDSLIANVVNTRISDNVDASTEWLPATVGILIDTEIKLNLVNSTIGNNECLYDGAAIQLKCESEANIVNSIIYGNEPYNICLNGSEGPNKLNCWNSLIEEGEDGIYQPFGNNSIIIWDDETMLDEDPLWLGPGFDWPYALSANSPCIDTGTLDLPYGVEIPAYDLAGNPRVCGSAIDMGAYEFPGNPVPINLYVEDATLSWQLPAGYNATGFNIYLEGEFLTTLSDSIIGYTFRNLIVGNTYIAGVSALYDNEETAIISREFLYEPVSSEEETIDLLQIQITNYPNPFNPETTVQFSVTQNSDFVTLEVYNIRGQKVKDLSPSLCHSEFIEGRGETQYSVTWNGTDQNNQPVSSGIYMYQLKVDGKAIASNKMLLLK